MSARSGATPTRPTPDAEHALATTARRGYLILRGFAEEEAAKALILLDAARCPITAREERARQLGKALQHLSRLIYSEICSYRPKDFAELRDGVERLREEYFLDGPAGFDWIYRNRLLQDREGTLYVDYVELEDGCRWDAPNERVVELLTVGPAIRPASLAMICSLSRVGALTPAGVEIVANVWRPCVPSSDTQWATFRALGKKTLETLGQAGLGEDAEGNDIVAVRDNWPFPIWSLETSLREVRFEDIQTARAALAARYPDGY